MLYKGVINDSYYKAIYDTQMGTGFDFSFNKLDNRTIENLLTEKWQGSNYSKRIWNNTDILADSISELVGGALLSGQSYAKTSRQLRDRFNVAKYYSDRLVRTETNYFHNQVDAMAYEEMGIDKYVFVATLDSRTSEICQEMDNKVFDYKDMAVGDNYPPLHPNCRSTTRGYLGKEAEAMLQRRAKNPETGKYETIPNMSYKEWSRRNGLNLTEQEKEKLERYTGFDATRINPALRKAKKFDDIQPALQNKIKIIDSAISKAKPLKEDLTVYRGALHTNFTIFENMSKITDDDMLALNKRVITDKAFISTSRIKAEEKGRNVIMKIKIPKGFEGALDIEPYTSPKYKYQQEILLKRNCNFYVNSVIIKDNKYYLDVEVLK